MKAIEELQRLRELPENLLEIRQVHQLPQPPDLVIRDDPPLIQHDHPRADLLRHFQHVRDVQDGLPVPRQLRDQLNAGGARLDTLSMGMSGDFEAAIAEGATIVRLGTALFGPRPA